MKPNRYFHFTYSCLFSVLLIIYTQSSLLFAGNAEKYSYYELSGTSDEKIIIKLNAGHLPLHAGLLQEQYQLTVREVTEQEAASYGRRFVMRGGIMTSQEDGDPEQRQRIETRSVAGMLRDGLSLYSDESQSRQIDTIASEEGPVTVDFAFQSGGNLGLMMNQIHQALSALHGEGHIRGYRVREIEHLVGRRGALVVDVTTSAPVEDFRTALSRRFAGFFSFRSHQQIGQLQPTFDEIQLSIATNNMNLFNRNVGALRELRRNQNPHLQQQIEGSLYLYSVNALDLTSTPDSGFFVLSDSSRLQNNSAFSFTLIPNPGGVLHRLPVRLQNTVVLSGQGGAESEMPILYELLIRGQILQNSPPSDRDNYSIYIYRISFAQREDETVTDFVGRFVDFHMRLRSNEYFQSVVTGVSRNEENITVLRFTYARFVRKDNQQDHQENRQFIRRARAAELSVGEVYLYQHLTLMLEEESHSAGIWSRLAEWLPWPGRLRVSRAATPPDPSVELENMEERNPDRRFMRRPTVEQTDHGASGSLLER